MKIQSQHLLKPITIAGLVMSNQVFISSTQKPAQRPNILFIAVDDLKPELGCYGNSLIKTPNIDRLAARGTVFMKNYCQQAVSGPTRASLMTGKRPDYTKVWDLKTKMRDINPDILSIPQYFMQQGYITAGIGKIYDYRCIDDKMDEPSWSLPYYDIPSQYYFNNQKTILGYYQNPETRNSAQKYIDEAVARGLNPNEARQYAVKNVRPSSECMDLPDNAYNDGAMADRAKEILTSLTKENKPFFFAVGFARPHLPFVAPRKYWDLYDRNEMPLAQFTEHAKNSPEMAYHNSGELREYTDIPPLTSFSDIKSNHIRLPEEKQKELIHGYYASVSYIDAQIGKIIKLLDSLRLSENTIIVLWGDHGWHLGDHDLWCKHTNFEQAARAPLLISDPDIKPGVTQSLSEFVDIFPTLCDLAGLTTPEGLDGKSLVPLMKNTDLSVKEYAVSQYPRGDKMGYSIRTGQYRLTWWMEDGFRSYLPFKNELIMEKELYDYEKDPLETINVANDKKYNNILREVDKMMVQFFASHYLSN